MFKSDYYLLFKRIGFALILFILSRLGFYFYNYNYFQAAALDETFSAFVLGLRFDLATALIANLFFIIASLIPFRNKAYEKTLKWGFVCANTIFLGFIIGDYEFFAFNGKKLTYDLFLMGGDVQDQFLQLIGNYWYLSLLVILCFIILWRLYPKRPFFNQSKASLLFSLPVSFLLFVLTGIGIRGGLQLRSISPKEAFVFKSQELGNFALNSAYTLVRSFGDDGLKAARFFDNDSAALDFIQSRRSFDSSEIGAPGQNVVIIIVESLSQEYVDEGYAPFISQLAKKSLYFPRNFANGRRSMEALPSIMASFPSIIGTPIYQTQYQSNKFYALPRVLKDNGYTTAFFHGGKRGTMDFDAYCYSIGFDQYFSMDEYPNQEHFDGHWGIYDHRYLDFFSQQLDTLKKPFFAGVFTLSSHQPYSIPKEFLGKFKKGSLPIHESIGYADEALRRFFEQAQTKPWYKDTLFIITADHTQKLETKRFQTLLGRYRVPLIFYHPSKELKASKDKQVTQHVDIMPSVLDFLDIEADKKLYYGSSVFNTDSGQMLNFTSGNHYLLKGNTMLSFDGIKAKAFDVENDYLRVHLRPGKLERGPGHESVEVLTKELKALIQYTNNGLRNNNIYQVPK